MLAIQPLFDTAVFLAALVGAVYRLLIFRIGRGGRIVRHAFRRVAVLCMLVDALGHKGIAVLGVFVIAGRPLDALGIAAVGVVFCVVFA